MDGINWRHTLVSWINQTNFIEKPIEDIAYFDINEFFAKFKEKMLDHVEIKEDLMTFIKIYYPQFEPHLDETGQITVPDYMYIYSLFLHFSCIKFPDPFFQHKCIVLKPKCQSAIQGFLEILTKTEKFDRNSLRTAIHESTPASPRLSFLHLNFSTPTRTPKNFKNSPPTPTAQLLDEKGREVKLLKAQLESEKYERGFLEVQIKQYEERLSKLVSDQKHSNQEILDLQNKLLSHETENFSPNRIMKEEEAKKKLRQKVALKDEKILELKFELDSMNEKYKALSDKFAYTDKEMRKKMSLIQDLNGDVNELNIELQQKLEIIENLKMQVQDLENHISQTRASVPKEVLDSSGDLLNFSFNQGVQGGVNCFSDETESENMGVIIDIKLKETERENNELRNEINRHNQEFTAHIKNLLLKLNADHAISEAVTLEEHIQVMIQAHEELNARHVDLTLKMEKCQLDLQTKENELNEMNKLRDTLKAEIEKSKEDVQQLNELKENLKQKFDQLEDKYNEIESLAENAAKNYDMEKTENNRLNSELTELNQNSVKLQSELQEKIIEIQSLHKNISEGLERESDLKKMHEILEDDYKNMSESYEKLKAKCAAYSKEGHKIKEKLKEMEKNLQDNNEVQETLRAEIEKLKNEMSLKETNCKSLENDLKTSQTKEMELKNEIDDLKNQLTENNSKFNEIKSQLETALIEAETVSKTLNDEISEKNIKIEEISRDLENTQSELNEKIENLNQEIANSSQSKAEYEKNMEILKESHAKMVHELTTKIEEQTNSQNLIVSQFEEKISSLSHSLKEISDEKSILEKSLEETHNTKTKLGHDLERVQHELEKERSATINSQELLNKTIASLKTEIESKVAEIDQIKLNSELNGDELTQQINELQVAQMKAVEEKRALEEKSKLEFKTLKEGFLKDQSAFIAMMNKKQDSLIAALNEVQPRIEKLQEMLEKLSDQIKTEKDINRNLNLKNKELEENLTQAKSEITNLESLTVKIPSLEKTISESKETNSKLLEENRDLKCQNESLSNVATRYSQAIDTGNRTIEELTQNLNCTDQELQRVNSEKNALESEIRSHLSNIHQLETDLNAAEIEMNEFQLKIKEKSYEIEKYQGLYEEEKQLTESLKQELDINKAEKSALTDSVKQLEAECVSISDKLDDLKQSHEKMSSEKIELDSQITLLNEEKTVLIQSLDKLSTENHTLMEENDAINSSNKKVIEKLELIAIQKQQTSKNISVLKETVQSLKRENQKLKLEIQSTVKENIDGIQEKLQKLSVLEKIGGEYESAKIEIDQYRIVNQELIEKNKAFDKEIQTKNCEIQEKEKLISNFESKLKSIQDENKEITSKSEHLSEKLKSIQLITDEKQSEIDMLTLKIDEIQASLVQKEGERNLFEIELKKHENELRELQEKLHEQERCLEEKNEDLEIFTQKLEKLSLKETSTCEENKKLQEHNESLLKEIQNLNSDFVNLRELTNSSEIEVQDLRKQVSNLSQEKSLLERDLARIETDRKSIEEESARVKQELQDHQSTLKTEIATLNVEAAQFKEENHKLQQNIFELQQKLRESESELENFKITSQTEITELRGNYDNLVFEHSKAKEQLEDIQNNVSALTQQNTELKTQNEKIRLENKTLVKSNDELQVKYSAVKEVSSSKADIERLEKQFKESDKEKQRQNEKLIEMFTQLEQYKNEITAFKLKEEKYHQDFKIIQAKLYKERDHANQNEKKYSEEISSLKKQIENQESSVDHKVVELRTEYEGKLQKMKEKMTTIYNDNMNRVKAEHLTELTQFRDEHAEMLEKYNKIKATSEKLSKQLHVKNEENLELRKENEHMKYKLTMVETRDSISGSMRSINSKKSANMPPPFGGNFKMEDEPGEVFDNTYLMDLKTGRMRDDFSTAARDSLSLAEIQRRNSQWQPHLRSAYPSTFTDFDANEDEIRDGMLIADDSSASLIGQNKVKKIGGKTAYHRPGPPTPSKNAGRLSIGAESLPEGRVSGVMPKKESEKSKLNIFRSSKVKDEASASPARRRLSNLFSRNRK